MIFRAISVQLADRHQRARLAVVIVPALLLAGYVRVDSAGDCLVRAPRLVLVDQRGPLAVVAHAGHQILDPRAASSGEGVAGMPQVMDVQAA